MASPKKEGPGGNRGDSTATDTSILLHVGSSINHQGCFNPKEIHVSMFREVTGKTPMDVSLADVLNDIQTGRYEQQVSQLRAYLPDNRKQYDTEKKKLPAFTVSGTAISRTKPGQHSNLLQGDLDKLGSLLPEVRDRLKLDRHVAFGFVSPSGDGLKLGVMIDGNRHADSFRAVEAYLWATYQVHIDSRCKDQLRLCFVSHDKELWMNVNAVPLPIVGESTPTHSSESLHLNPCVTTSLNDCLSTSLHHNLESLKTRKDATARFKQSNPKLAQYYEKTVEPRFVAQVDRRNKFIVDAVPFLYRAVKEDYVLPLAEHFYDCNRPLFDDSREQHLKEAAAHLKAVARDYPESLTTIEQKYYEALNNDERQVFRICLDLALLAEPIRAPLTFYQSFDHLGVRLGIHPMTAQRLMRSMERFGIILLLEKGTKREKGIQGKAGTYKWLLRQVQSEGTKP